MILVSFLLVSGVFGITFSLPKKTPRDFFSYPHAVNDAVNVRIIGGDEASPHQFPYQVGLYCNSASGTTFCGGSLVSNNYILTAAHCLTNTLSVEIILGAHTITEDEDTQLRVTSEDFVYHSDWNTTTLVNDIGFIKLPEPVEENDYIGIVKIATGNETYSGNLGTISGWGRVTNVQDGVTPVLRYLTNDILSNEECIAIPPYDTVVQPSHLCLNGDLNSSNVGTCNGDSGGPLVVDGVQVGLVSFGYTDCDAGKPSVFTRLTEFSDWIRDHSDLDV